MVSQGGKRVVQGALRGAGAVLPTKAQLRLCHRCCAICFAAGFAVAARWDNWVDLWDEPEYSAHHRQSHDRLQGDGHIDVPNDMATGREDAEGALARTGGARQEGRALQGGVMGMVD